jgi:MFS family permease
MQLSSFLAHPRRYPTTLSYINGFFYGVGLNMLGVLVPLYAISLGWSLSDQGIVVAAPAIFMLLLRLPGGAICDRFGERPVLLFGFVCLIISALLAMTSATLLALVIAQLFNGASRSVYWSAGQSYTSRTAEGEAGKTMGRLLSFESTGGIVAAIAAGVLAQFIGYAAAFAIAAAINGLGVMVTSVLPGLPRKDQVRSIRGSLAPAGPMLVRRNLALAHLTAFTAAAYASLVGGLFLAFFMEVGYREGFAGTLRALNNVGVAVIAYPFGMLLARLGARTMAAVGMVATGVLTIVMALSGDLPIAPVLIMAASGMTFGTLRALYPALGAQNSEPNQRAMALAVVSLYWAAAMLIVPLAFGFIADAFGIRVALYIFGVFSILMGIISPLFHALAKAPEQSIPAQRGHG